MYWVPGLSRPSSGKVVPLWCATYWKFGWPTGFSCCLANVWLRCHQTNGRLLNVISRLRRLCKQGKERKGKKVCFKKQNNNH